MSNKILVVLGPTASGKSDLAVELARQFNGEVISADSRQVYKGLDIGSGKITKKEMRGISHYLLDVVKPQTIFTVARFQKLAERKIVDILKRGKLPIICGGTGLYIKALVDEMNFPKIKPDLKLRANLERKTPKELFKILKKLDLQKAKTIDSQNPHRLIRAIEIATLNTSSVKPSILGTSNTKNWEFLQIGLKTEREELKDRIAQRFHKRVRQGLVAEARRLHQNGLTYKRFSEIGLAHKYLAQYLQNKMSKDDFIEDSIKAEQRYARRQMTWFKQDKRIVWFALLEKRKIIKIVKNFLQK